MKEAFQGIAFWCVWKGREKGGRPGRHVPSRCGCGGPASQILAARLPLCKTNPILIPKFEREGQHSLSMVV